MMWSMCAVNYGEDTHLRSWTLVVTMCLSPLQRDFIMQTGDPTGTGRGGESVYRSVIFITTVDFCFKPIN